jgi:hypothetical protein
MAPSTPSLAFAIGREKEGAVRAAVERVRGLADMSPESTTYWLNVPRTVVLDLPDEKDLVAAKRLWFLWDLHSALCAQRLMYRWRAGQFGEAILAATEAWHLGVAATVSRSVVEMAAAYTVEANEILSAWRDVGVATPEEALEFRDRIVRTAVQMTMGTRRRDYLAGAGGDPAPVSQRTNIITLLEKAAKRLGNARLVQMYEELSDVAHPNFGATEYFYVEMGHNDEMKQLRTLINRRAVGRSDLALLVAEAVVWGLNQIVEIDGELGATLDAMSTSLELPKRIGGEVQYWGLLPNQAD